MRAVDVIEAIHGRRSIRSYEARQPDRALIEALIWDAAQAPPPTVRAAVRWSFVVIEGARRLAGLGERAMAFARASAPPGPTPAWLSDPSFKVFWDAPALILICRATAIPESDWDCVRAAQNLMLSAHARGLGACWVGSPMAWLRSKDGAAAAGIAEGFEAVAPVVIGWPRTTPPPRDVPRPEIVWSA